MQDDKYSDLSKKLTKLAVDNLPYLLDNLDLLI